METPSGSIRRPKSNEKLCEEVLYVANERVQETSPRAGKTDSDLLRFHTPRKQS